MYVFFFNIRCFNCFFIFYWICINFFNCSLFVFGMKFYVTVINN